MYFQKWKLFQKDKEESPEKTAKVPASPVQTGSMPTTKAPGKRVETSKKSIDTNGQPVSLL